MSFTIYAVLISLVVLERFGELVISRRHTRWSLARGGYEVAPGHYPWMVLIHTALLVGCLAEVYFLDRRSTPFLFFSMLSLSILCQALRWWVIYTLKEQWNTRIIVVPGLARVRKGPFRWLSHPNYLAVAIEGLALPLMGGAWITALVFTSANFAILGIRIFHENRALMQLSLPKGEMSDA